MPTAVNKFSEIRKNPRTFIIDGIYGNDSFPERCGYSSLSAAFNAAVKQIGIATTQWNPVVFEFRNANISNSNYLYISSPEQVRVARSMVFSGAGFTSSSTNVVASPVITQIYYAPDTIVSGEFFLGLFGVSVSNIISNYNGIWGNNVNMTITGNGASVGTLKWGAAYGYTPGTLKVRGQIIIQNEVSATGGEGTQGAAGYNGDSSDGTNATNQGEQGGPGGVGGPGGTGGVGGPGGNGGTLILEAGVVVLGVASSKGGRGGQGGTGGTGGSARGGQGGPGYDGGCYTDEFGNTYGDMGGDGASGGPGGTGGLGGDGGNGGQGGNGGTVTINIGCFVNSIDISRGEAGVEGNAGEGGIATGGEGGPGGYSPCGGGGGSQGPWGMDGTPGAYGNPGLPGTVGTSAGSSSVSTLAMAGSVAS